MRSAFDDIDGNGMNHQDIAGAGGDDPDAEYARKLHQQEMRAMEKEQRQLQE